MTDKEGRRRPPFYYPFLQRQKKKAIPLKVYLSVASFY